MQMTKKHAQFIEGVLLYCPEATVEEVSIGAEIAANFRLNTMEDLLSIGKSLGRALRYRQKIRKELYSSKKRRKDA